MKGFNFMNNFFGISFVDPSCCIDQLLRVPNAHLILLICNGIDQVLDGIGRNALPKPSINFAAQKE